MRSRPSAAFHFPRRNHGISGETEIRGGGSAISRALAAVTIKSNVLAGVGAEKPVQTLLVAVYSLALHKPSGPLAATF